MKHVGVNPKTIMPTVNDTSVKVVNSLPKEMRNILVKYFKKSKYIGGISGRVFKPKYTLENYDYLDVEVDFNYSKNVGEKVYCGNKSIEEFIKHKNQAHREALNIK